MGVLATSLNPSQRLDNPTGEKGAHFSDQLYVLTPKELRLATDIGRFGTSARGVVLAVVGGLIGVSAYHANPSQQVGMDTALVTILHQHYGIWLLGIVALGLIAFGFIPC